MRRRELGRSVQIQLRRNGDVHQLAIVLAARLVQQREAHVRFERILRGIEHRHAVQTGDLRLRVHLRCAGAILHRLPRKHGADLRSERGDLVVVRRDRFHDRQIDCARQLQILIRPEPRLEREAAFRREVGARRVLAHHRGERCGNVRDIGDERTLRREDGLLRREDSVDAELLHEPAFLARGVIAATRHRAGVPDRTRQLRFPTADDAGDDGLREVRVELVIAARLDIKHGRLAACVVR